MNRTFGWVIVGVLGFACAAFLWGTIAAGIASVRCDNPAETAVYKQPPQKPQQKVNQEPARESRWQLCNPKTGHPQINPLLRDLILPLAATLGTYFGAAIGIARRKDTPARRQARLRYRWGAIVSEDDPILSLLQTITGYVYFIGLLVAFGFLYADAGVEGVTDSPFTHLIIRSEGGAAIGVVIGIVALVLGVKPADPGG